MDSSSFAMYKNMSRQTWLNNARLKINERGTIKRRCSSPRHFPRKVHISEEKVAEELGNLCIGLGSTVPSTSAGKADFIYEKSKANRTFQEIEDSLEIDSISDVKEEKATFEMAPELAAEVKKLNRKILTVGSYWQSMRLPKPCQELVLWKPPSGAIAEVLNAIKRTDETTQDCSNQTLCEDAKNPSGTSTPDIENSYQPLSQDLNNLPKTSLPYSLDSSQTGNGCNSSEQQATDYDDFIMDYMEL